MTHHVQRDDQQQQQQDKPQLDGRRDELQLDERRQSRQQLPLEEYNVVSYTA